jgi:hypothetical protein
MTIASLNLEGSSAGHVVVVTTADEVKSLHALTGVDASPKHAALLMGWWQHNDVASLAEVNSSVSVLNLDGKWYQKNWAFAGLGFLIIIAYMDPGNWATELSGVASFGYTLLSIILISNFTAIFLQYLFLKLGIVTNQDLAQACQDADPKWVVYCLWIIMKLQSHLQILLNHRFSCCTEPLNWHSSVGWSPHHCSQHSVHPCFWY